MGKSSRKPKKQKNGWESYSDDSGTSSIDEPRRKIAAKGNRSPSGRARSASEHTQSSGVYSVRLSSDEPMEIDDDLDNNCETGRSGPELPHAVKIRLLDRRKKDGFGRDAHVLREFAKWLGETQKRNTEVNMIEVAMMLGGANQIYKSQLKSVKDGFKALVDHCSGTRGDEAVDESEDEDLSASKNEKKKRLSKSKNPNETDDVPLVIIINEVDNSQIQNEVVVVPHDKVPGEVQNQEGKGEPPNVELNRPEPAPGASVGITGIMQNILSGQNQETGRDLQLAANSDLPTVDAEGSETTQDSGLGGEESIQNEFVTPFKSQPLTQDSGFGGSTQSFTGSQFTNSLAITGSVVRSLDFSPGPALLENGDFDATIEAADVDFLLEENMQLQPPVKKTRRRLVMPPRQEKEPRKCAIDVGELIRCQLELPGASSKRSSKLPVLRSCFDTVSLCSNASSRSMPCLSIQGSPAREELMPSTFDEAEFGSIGREENPVATLDMSGHDNAFPFDAAVPVTSNYFVVNHETDDMNRSQNIPSTSAGLVQTISVQEETTIGRLSEAQQALFSNLSRNMEIMFHQLVFENMPHYVRKGILRDVQIQLLRMKDASSLSPAPLTNENTNYGRLSCDEILRNLLAEATAYVENILKPIDLQEVGTQWAPAVRANPHGAIAHRIPREIQPLSRVTPIQERLVKRFLRIPHEYIFNCESQLTAALRRIIASAGRASNVEVDIRTLEQRLVAVMVQSNNSSTVIQLLQLAAHGTSPRIATGCFFSMMQMLESKKLHLEGVDVNTEPKDVNVQLVTANF